MFGHKLKELLALGGTTNVQALRVVSLSARHGSVCAEELGINFEQFGGLTANYYTRARPRLKFS